MQQNFSFDFSQPQLAATPTERRRELSQYLTPLWVAEALVERHFGNLDRYDLVLEPSCGTGSFLHAIAGDVPAVGVEIDPELAAIARRDTGRPVIVDDFRTATLDFQPTVVIGNPPFSLALIDRFLQRSHELLPEGGRVGFILPAYALNAARRVSGYSERWSIAAEMIPRTIYPRLRESLVFALFSKDQRRVMVGLALFHEAASVQALPKRYREIIAGTRGSLWRAVCRHALERLGGAADLAEIYDEIEGNQPTTNRFWRDRVRAVLREYSDDFSVLATGRFALTNAAACAA